MPIPITLTRKNIARLSIVAVFSFIFIYFVAIGSMQKNPETAVSDKVQEPPLDDAKAREAFKVAYSVFTQARCMNCHPSGNQPLQGDDSRPHAFLVQRGKDGRGLPGMRCANCHQNQNAPGEHAPPGAGDEAGGWQLPPPETPMVFEGRTVKQLCEQLKDPKQTHGRTIDEVLEHMSTALVVWAWEPGEGRTPPPIGYAEFIQKLKDWRDNGGACPE